MPNHDLPVEVATEVAGTVVEVTLDATTPEHLREREENKRLARAPTRLRSPGEGFVAAIFGLAMVGGGGFSYLAEHGLSHAVGPNLVLVWLCLACTWLLAEFVFVHYDLSDERVDFRLLHRRGSFRWEEIARVRYGAKYRRFTVQLASGVTVTVPATSDASPEFAVRVLERAEAAEIDELTRARLRALADVAHPPLR